MNPTVRHPSDAELRDFNGGRLPDAALDGLCAHLDECPPCCDRLNALAASDRVLPWLRQTAARPSAGDETMLSEAHPPTPPDPARDETQLLKSPSSPAGRDAGALPSNRVAVLPAAVPGASAPPSIPGYAIEGILGRGGMGVVYKARHLSLKRTVALKVVLAGGHAGPREVARFRIEAEAVARLLHPNIVQIHEVGEAGGYPYCALEFVPGGDLAGKLDGKTMPVGEAAKLVETLARAMQMAHSRNVVHRDLKPANVLLTADGTPKITDFGLARQLDSDSGETQAGTVMGTPSYMAPEQASGNAHSAGPAADVYSLGAILYDCLAGRPPFKGKTVVETLDQVRTQEPVPPSRLREGVPLDLETICLKCLRKEPEHRYASAAELADELVRYRQGEPILARPVGRIERGVKWVNRNPVVAGLAAAVVLALAAGATVSYLKYRDAEQQKDVAESRRKDAEEQGEIAEARRKDAEHQKGVAEDRRKDAELQRETAQAVSEFLGGLFEDADPIARTGRTFGARNRGEGVLTALEVVDRGAAKLKTALTDKPRIRAALLDRIGNVYLDLGRAREAEPLLQEAMQIRSREVGADHLELAASLQSIGLLHFSVGDMVSAGNELERALALRRKHLGDNHPLVADTLFHLGTVRMVVYDFPQAERWFQECLTIRRNNFGKENREVALVLLVLGQAYCLNDQFTKAIPLIDEAAALIDKIEGKNDFSSIVSLFTRAQFAHRLGNAKQARALYQEADEKAVRLLGEDHYLVNFSRGMFSDLLKQQGEHEAAARVLRGVVASFRKSFGPDSLILTTRLITLARLERTLNRPEEAEAVAREAVRIHRKHRSQQPSDLKNRTACLHVLAALVYARGDLAEADTFYREGLAISLRQGLGEADRTHELACDLARLLLRREDVPVSPDFTARIKATGKPETDFALAQTWAQAARTLKQRPLSPAADDGLILDHFQKRAVLLLRGAVAGGMRDAKAIASAAEFQPLQARTDYQELLRELAETTPDK